MSLEVGVEMPGGAAEAALDLTLYQNGAVARRMQIKLPVRAVERIVRIELPAERAALTAPVVLDQSGPFAYVHAPRTAEFVAEPRPATGSDGGFATFAVSVPADGRYQLGADVCWLDPEGNSFYISIDGEPDRVFGNSGEMKRWSRTR